MAGRETRIPKGLVPHRRSGIHRGFSYIAHNRRNVRFKGLWRDTRHPSPELRTQRLTRRNRGCFGWGRYSTLGAFCAVRKPCAAGCQSGKLCRFWALVVGAPEERREPSGQRCAYARRCSAGVAAPLGCVIPLLFLLPHRWASRFWSAASLAHRKLSTCSLVTAVRFLNRCSRRSMRETYPLERRSDCRF